MKRVAAGAHLLTLRRLSLQNVQMIDRTDFCLACSFLFQCKQLALDFYNWVDWDAPSSRDWVELWRGFGPMSIPSEQGHRAMPMNFLSWKKSLLAPARFKAGTSGPESSTLRLCQTGSTSRYKKHDKYSITEGGVAVKQNAYLWWSRQAADHRVQPNSSHSTYQC